MASLLGELQESGSRLEDGAPNAGGKCWFFIPGTTTPVNVYTDADLTAIATQPVVLDDGGRIPTADYPDGIWLTQRVRLYVEDSGGGTVADTTYTPADAGNSALESDYYTGTTVEEALDAIGASVGGVDGQYKESLGATSVPIATKFRQQGIWVGDFGAVGNGVAIDTTAIQAAVNRAVAVGATDVLFPAGTFKTDQAIAVTSGASVHLIGRGKGSTIITPTHGTANAFTFTGCAAAGIKGMSILHTAGSTGAAVAIGGASTDFQALDMFIPANGTYAGFAYGLDFSGTSDYELIQNCFVNADTVALRVNATTDGSTKVAIGNGFGASVLAPVSPTSAIELNGSNGNYYFYGNGITGATNNVLFNAALTGTVFRFFGNTVEAASGSVPFKVTGMAADPVIFQQANGADTTATSGATGTPQTPIFVTANRVILAATSGGAGTVVVNAPAILPGTASGGKYWDMVFVNAAGGAVTWDITTATVYKFAAAVPTTAAHTISVRVYWDGTAFREASRADTVT